MRRIRGIYDLRDIYGPQTDSTPDPAVYRAPAVRCVSAWGYGASLRHGAIYRRLDDPEAAAQGLIRVVDESGEDYLYPAGMFEVAA